MSSRILFSRLLLVAFAVVLYCCSHPAVAQTFRGGIHGTVEDSSGAALTGAEVRAENTGTGQVDSTTTTSAGSGFFSLC